MAEFNLIVENEFFTEDTPDLFFPGETTSRIPPEWTMADVLVHCGIFSSKSQARKNWTRTGMEVPDGFTDLIGIGKKGHRITILKPTKDNLPLEGE